MRWILPLERINIFRSSDFRDKINEIINAVNALMGRASTDGAPATPEVTRREGIPVELTARSPSGSGKWQFREVIWNTSTNQWDVKSGGLTHTELGEVFATGGPVDSVVNPGHVGAVVYITPRLIHDGTGISTWEFTPAPVLMPVLLTNGTGSDGEYNTSEASYTYDITDLDGNTLETGLTPQIQRDECPVTTATHGLAYIDEQGNWKLLWVNEAPDHSRGYWQLEGTDGSEASEIFNPDGKIQFDLVTAGTGTGTQIPVHVVVSNDGLGTDTLQAYIYGDDVPGGGAADGQGYEVVRHNNGAVDAVTDGGVFDFDDSATTSSGEYPVEWELTGNLDAVAGGANDQLRTRIRGKVDLGPDDFPPSAGSSLAWEGWITLEANTAVGSGTITLSTEDWRGRLIRLNARSTKNTIANANATAQWGLDSAGGVTAFCGASMNTEEIINTTGGVRIIVDGTDSGKLKAESGSNFATDPNQVFFVIKASKSANTNDETIT